MPWKKLGEILICSLVPIPFLILLLNQNWPNFILLVVTFICYSGILLLIYHKLRIADISQMIFQIKNLVSVRKKYEEKA